MMEMREPDSDTVFVNRPTDCTFSAKNVQVVHAASVPVGAWGRIRLGFHVGIGITAGACSAVGLLAWTAKLMRAVFA